MIRSYFEGNPVCFILFLMAYFKEPEAAVEMKLSKWQGKVYTVFPLGKEVLLNKIDALG